MALEIKESVVHGYAVVHLSGTLDFSVKGVFMGAVGKYVAEQGQRVLIDVHGLSFIDSAGIGMLALNAKKIQNLNGEVMIVNPRDQVRTCLQDTNFSALIPVMDTDPSYSTFTPTCEE